MLMWGISGCTDMTGTTLGRLTGVVYQTPDGHLTIAPATDARPVAGVEVRLANQQLRAFTDSQGSFTLDLVPAGSPTVFISSPGKQSLSGSVTISPASTTTLAAASVTPVDRQWTVLVFMNADNNLERFGILNMNQMESAPDSEAVTVAVQLDRSPSYDTSNGDWSGTRRYKIEHDADSHTITSVQLADLGSVDMGQPATLREFISWGMSAFPARHYLLVIWNHGAGWRANLPAMRTMRGISFDDTHGTFIATTDLPNAVSAATPLDVIAFDASLMQMLEVAYQLRNSCSYIVGSEESPPGSGYPYQYILGNLIAKPQQSPRELAQAIPQETLDYYGVNSGITQSALEINRLDDLAGALDRFAGALLPLATTEADMLGAARDTTEHYATLDNRDLADYAMQVKDRVTDVQVKIAAVDLLTTISSAVIANTHGSAHQNSHGISIYLPTPGSYTPAAPGYILLALSSHTRWANWLAAQQK